MKIKNFKLLLIAGMIASGIVHADIDDMVGGVIQIAGAYNELKDEAALAKRQLARDIIEVRSKKGTAKERMLLAVNGLLQGNKVLEKLVATADAGFRTFTQAGIPKLSSELDKQFYAGEVLNTGSESDRKEWAKDAIMKTLLVIAEQNKNGLEVLKEILLNSKAATPATSAPAATAAAPAAPTPAPKPVVAAPTPAAEPALAPGSEEDYVPLEYNPDESY